MEKVIKDLGTNQIGLDTLKDGMAKINIMLLKDYYLPRFGISTDSVIELLQVLKRATYLLTTDDDEYRLENSWMDYMSPTTPVKVIGSAMNWIPTFVKGRAVDMVQLFHGSFFELFQVSVFPVPRNDATIHDNIVTIISDMRDEALASILRSLFSERSTAI